MIHGEPNVFKRKIQMATLQNAVEMLWKFEANVDITDDDQKLFDAKIALNQAIMEEHGVCPLEPGDFPTDIPLGDQSEVAFHALGELMQSHCL
ncbi:MAG: hypothetical protein WCV73_01765 [Patescibacteria group bacterium]